MFCQSFIIVRDVIVDETNFKLCRPVAKPEGVNSKPKIILAKFSPGLSLGSIRFQRFP